MSHFKQIFIILLCNCLTFLWYLKTYLSLMKRNYTVESAKRVVCRHKIEMYHYLNNKLKSQL